MNKFRISLTGFCSALVVFLLVNTLFGSTYGEVAKDNSAESHRKYFIVPPSGPFASTGKDVGLYSLYNETETIELAGKIVEFEIVQPETGLELQKVVVNREWTGVYLIYSDNPLENIKQRNRDVSFYLDELVINSSTIVVSERLEDINASLTEELYGKFRINGNPATGFGAGKMKMRAVDVEGKEHYAEGPYQAGRVDWYVVINSNQSIAYEIVGDLPLEELKKIAGTMKKPEWVLAKSKPLPIPSSTEPVGKGKPMES